MSSVTPHQSNGVGSRPLAHLVIRARSTIKELAYLPDGRRIVTGSNDGTLRVWNLEDGKQQGTSMEHRNTMNSLSVTRDGTKIISSNDFGSIKVWNVKSHKLFKEWTHPEWFPKTAISPDDGLVAVGFRTLFIYTMDGGLGWANWHSIKVGNSQAIWSMSFSPNGKKLACGTGDEIHVYDVERGMLSLGPLHDHEKSVHCVLWSPDGSRIFSASHDKTIRCWNFDTGEQIGQPWSGITGWIGSPSLSPNGLILASVLSDNTVRFLDATSGHTIQYLLHCGEVKIACICPTGESVVSSTGDGNIYLWREPWMKSMKHCAPLPDVAHNLQGFGPVYASLDCYSTSSLAAEPHCELSTFGAGSPPPLDLTLAIDRIKNQHIAGGSFGDVYRCHFHCDSPPMEVAVKALRFSFMVEDNKDNKSIKMLRRELGIWRRLSHKNIVPFLGIAYGFGMDGAMSLVSLWMANESLHRFLAKYDNNLAMVHRLQFLLDIANGLHYLHSLPIVHGDLNLGNIPEALAYLQRSTARPGALRWSAPEQILSEEVDNRTTKSDMYSFGCVALQLLSGKQPWSEIHADGAVVLRLAKGHKPRRPESRLIDDSHWNLIQECWLPMEDRPAAEAVKSAIQQFLSHCPHSPSLYDLLPSSSNQADLGVKLPSSLSKAPMESSSAPFSPATINENDQHSIALLSDTMRFYPPHGNEQHHTSLTGKRLVSRERTVKPDEERSLKKRRV